MVRRSQIPLLAAAVLAVGLSLFNASWLATPPPGRLALVAHRGVAQPVDRAAAAGDGCDARHLRAADHNMIENTIFSMQNAMAFGAHIFMLDVHASADRHAMIFRDAELACRTNGTGRVADRSLAELEQLDVGYGYSRDGGHSFPLRGRGVGAMPTAEEVLRSFPAPTSLIFTLSEPRDADALVADFGRAGVAISDLDGFAGSAAALTRLRQLTRAGWILDRAASDACLAGYRTWGWLGLVPESCHGTTVVVPRRGQWTFWGWPYRFLGRMAAAGARLYVEGDDENVGLEQPEQLGEVPHDYHGLLLIEDMYEVGRALRG